MICCTLDVLIDGTSYVTSYGYAGSAGEARLLALNEATDWLDENFDTFEVIKERYAKEN